MKKRLEADLISIAHRILQLKNKSDVNQLFLETQKLYEKLSVLRFVEEQYGEAKPTIGHAAIVSDIETFYDNEAAITPTIETLVEDNVITETTTAEPLSETVRTPNEIITENQEDKEATATIKKPTTEAIATIEKNEVEEIIESTTENDTTYKAEEEIESFIENDTTVEEEIEDNAIEEAEGFQEIEKEIFIEEKLEPIVPPAFKPNFSLSNTDHDDEIIAVATTKKAEAVQISFEDFLGVNYNEPQFVKVDEIKAIPPTPLFEPVKIATQSETATEKITAKVVSLNDKFSKGIDIDLNDQIAFVKHLFGNSREDYNRVMNQLITFDTFYETKAFIDEMVKPDYNEWKGKDDYEERFMEIIEKKFL